VVVTSYFLIPLFLDRTYLNNNNLPRITYDSFGHSAVLIGLAKDHLFDFGRFPSLTILMAVGFVFCLLRWRQEQYLIPVTIFLLWLLLFFGRSTWGVLIDVLPMSRQLHMIRFMAMVHLGGIFLMAVALAAPWRWAVSRSNVWYFAGVLALTSLLLLPVYNERRSYLVEKAFLSDRKPAGSGQRRTGIKCPIRKTKATTIRPYLCRITRKLGQSIRRRQDADVFSATARGPRYDGMALPSIFIIQ
jgi:hypothetical protein